MPDFSFSTRFSRTMLIDLILFFLFIPSVDLLHTNALCFMLTAKEMCASENRGISIEARKRKTKQPNLNKNIPGASLLSFYYASFFQSGKNKENDWLYMYIRGGNNKTHLMYQSPNQRHSGGLRSLQITPIFEASYFFFRMMQITSQYGILTPSIVSIGTVCYVYHRSFNSPRSCWKIRPKLSGPLDRTEAHLPSLWSTTHKMIITTPHRPLFHFFLGCCNTLSRFFYIFGKVSWRRRIIKLMGSHGHPIGLHLITG